MFEKKRWFVLYWADNAVQVEGPFACQAACEEAKTLYKGAVLWLVDVADGDEAFWLEEKTALECSEEK